MITAFLFQDPIFSWFFYQKMKAESSQTTAGDSTFSKQLRIDPEIVQHQEEWADLYSQTFADLIENDEYLHYNDQEFDPKPYIQHLFTWLSYEDRKILQNIWFYAAIRGRSIFFPYNKHELFLYSIYESKMYNAVIDGSIICMIIFSVLESKQCFSLSYSSTNNFQSHLSSSFIFLVTLLQLFDIYLFSRTVHWYYNEAVMFPTKLRNYIKQDYSVIWQILRFVSLFVIAMNCLLRFTYATLPNFSQVGLLFLIIPRREDLQQLASGILDAVRQLRQIFLIWFVFLILWSFFGFCLLRRYDDDKGNDDTSTGHFSTYWSSLYVCFHCILSRPTVLYRLKPVFSQNNFIAFYFVLLTIFGDILISALVIAMGTRAFRQFSRQNLNGRLRYRQAALSAIFAVYSDKTAEINRYSENTVPMSTANLSSRRSIVESKLSFIQWYNYCLELPHPYRIPHENDIRIIFLIEDKENSSFITEQEFIRLFSLLARKLIFFTGNLQLNPIVCDVVNETRKNSMKNTNVYQKHYKDGLSHTVTNEKLKSNVEINQLPVNISISSDDGANSTRNPSTSPHHRLTGSIYELPQYLRSQSTNVLYFCDALSEYVANHTTAGSFYQFLRRKIFSWYYYHILVPNPFFKKPQTEESPASTTAQHRTSYVPSERYSESSAISQLKFSNYRTHKYIRINSFSLYQIFLISFMVLQTSLLSSNRKLIGGIILGWLLLLFLVIEGAALTIVSKKSKSELRMIWCLNFLLFIFYCILSSNNPNLNSTFITLIIILQSFRFILVLSNFIVFQTFVKIIPVFKRAVVFYLMIIYSFAWVGHVTLCGLMDPDDVNNTDDDSHGWGVFSTLLNFNTIFSSFYTMAASAVLSNWSMIMDAALASNRSPVVLGWIYFYFFTFRFFTVLILLPLLMSCVIQTYMQYFPMTASEKRKKDSNLDHKNKLSLDYYHVTIKYKDADSISALWSTDGKAKVCVVKSSYTGKYGVSIEDLFNQEVLDSLDHQIFASKKLLLSYYEENYTADLLNKSSQYIVTTERNSEEESEIASGSSGKHAVDLKKASVVQSNYLMHLFHNKDVMLLQLKDVMIIRKQIKWMKDYHDFEKSCRYVNYEFINNHLLNLSKSSLENVDKGKLASIWFNDGIEGFPLIYPTDSFSLKLLTVLRSWEMISLLYLIAVLQMLAVFLTIPQCFSSGAAADGAGGAIISLKVMSGFDAICCFIYAVEIVMDYLACWKTYSTYKWLEVNGKSWLVIRIIAIVFIFLKSIVTIANASSPLENLRIVRVFFPLLVISRSSNFYDIFHGISVSMKGTRPVYLLFAFLVVLFAFSGFWLFQRFPTHADRFPNFPTSLLTILHSSTSAPFSLYIILPYYDISELSPIFFLILSYASEILVINLIIGTGSVFFNRYGESVIKMRREKQFNAFVAIFLLLSSIKSKDFITYQQFLHFCTHLPARYFITSHQKDPLLFEKVLFSLLLYVKKDVVLLNDINQITHGTGEKVMNSDYPASDEKHFYESWKINREEFIQLLFIIFNGIVSEFQNYNELAVGNRPVSSKKPAVKPVADKHSVGNNDETEIELTTFNSTKVDDYNNGSFQSDADVKNPLRQKNLDEEKQNARVSSKRKLETEIFKDEIPFAICEISIKNQETSSFTVESFRTHSLINRESLISIIKFCQFLTFQQLIVAGLQPVSLLDIASFLAHFLLLIQLFYFTSMSMSNSGWLGLLYFLEFFFIAEMCIRIISLGELRFFSDSMQVVRGMINFFTLLFMIIMGNDFSQTTNGWYLLVVTLQCIRLILFCTRVRGNGRYRLAIKNTARSLFLLFLFLYFWTIIAQDIFCGVLQNDTVTGSTTNDDDATNWNQFSDILNFNNYQQTLFTLFEVSVLGSWSMVMDAAARQDRHPAVSIFFFFFFRLLVALVFLPLLMSFMVRSFIALYDQIAFVSKHRKKVFKMVLDEKHKRLEMEDHENAANTRAEKESVDNEFNSLPKLSVSVRHFYNPQSHVEKGRMLQVQHDFDDEYETREEFDNNDTSQPNPTADKMRAGQSFALLKHVSQLSRYFHFRPAKPNRFTSSISYVEIWDMLALKEADDNALYNPYENQTLLNLENYRLQMQYYSFLLYFKYKSYSQKSTPKSSSKSVRTPESEKEDVKEDSDDESAINRDDPSRFTNQYYEKTDQPDDEDDDKTVHDVEENAEESKLSTRDKESAVVTAEQSEYVPNPFAEGLFESRPHELTEKELDDDKIKKKAKRRLSNIIDEIKHEVAEEFGTPHNGKNENAHHSPLATPNTLNRLINKNLPENEERARYYKQVESLLRVNHSLNQVIHNIFVDYNLDQQRQEQNKRVQAHSLSTRFSVLVKDD
jgi:hypothetical protein